MISVLLVLGITITGVLPGILLAVWSLWLDSLPEDDVGDVSSVEAAVTWRDWIIVGVGAAKWTPVIVLVAALVYIVAMLKLTLRPTMDFIEMSQLSASVQDDGD